MVKMAGDSSPSMKQESTVKKRRAKKGRRSSNEVNDPPVGAVWSRAFKFKLNIQPATWLTSTGNEREICVFNDN